jgi:hypothetical protein
LTVGESRSLRFPVTIFLSAFLLFQVQPIIARYLLPWFGGSPAVWAACVLFFEAVLLAGYLYAHWVRSIWIHITLLAISLLFLPAAPRADVWKPTGGGDPSLRILLLLAATVGAPYFLLSATAPLLQRWFSQSEPGKSPWRLYALSNLGSFLALLSYPFAIEPFVRLRTQSWIWSGIYVVFAAICAWTAWRMRSIRAAPAEASDVGNDPRPGPWRILFWLGLSASGSTLLLATTNQISQEIAVSPFLWIAPLSVYLLSFVLTFESGRWYRRGAFAVMAGLGAAAICGVASAAVVLSLWTQLAVYLAGLFAACMVCHGELVRSRPSPRHLTEFYYVVAAGGVLGGVFVALIAPHIFTEFSEYPIGLAAACLLGLAGWVAERGLKLWSSRNLVLRIPVMALLLGGVASIADAVIVGDVPGVASRRNFYGILRVSQQDGGTGPIRVLTHGRTIHGFQYLDGPRRAWATAYYGPHSGAALALNALPGARRIAVIGLGAGTLAAWGRPGDSIRFYEINPDVQAIANTWFFYLKDSRARTEVVLGDARVQLEHELAEGRAQDFDAIVVDAFSSDNIPLHLLTAECGDIYRRHLTPGGLLLLHISNRTLDLEPVARGLARHLGWQAVPFVSGDNGLTGESAATWVLMTANSGFLNRAGIANEVSAWTTPQRPPLVWTDDFASLWHVLRFR